MFEILNDLGEIFDGLKTDEKTDEKLDYKSTLENEQIDTTNIPDLESEESAAQKRNQEPKGLKLLTPNQMLSRLPIL